MKLSLNFVKDYIDIEEDVKTVAEKMTKVGNEYEYDIVLELPDKISAPVLKGDEVGKLHIVVDSEIVKSIRIVANADVEKQGFKDILDKIILDFDFIN